MVSFAEEITQRATLLFSLYPLPRQADRKPVIPSAKCPQGPLPKGGVAPPRCAARGHHPAHPPLGLLSADLLHTAGPLERPGLRAASGRQGDEGDAREAGSGGLRVARA